MKKVIATMFAMALLALTVTNASADPATSARAYAYGIDVGGSLLGDIIDQEPNVESVLPPGGDFEQDIITADLQPLALEGVGIVQAQTRVDATISDEIVLRPEGFRSGDGGATEGAGGLLGDLLGGGGGGDLLGSVLGGTAGSVGSFQAQQLGGGGEGGDLLGNLIGEDLLGDLGGGAEGDPEDIDENILIPAANARSFASIDLTGVATESDGGGGGGDLLGSLLGGTANTDTFGAAQLTDTETTLTRIVFEALLRLGVIEAEAVVTCAGGQPFFDLASRIVESQGSDLDIGETLNDLLVQVFGTVGDLAPELIDIEVGEQGITADGTGFFVNALHITVGQEILGQLPAPTDPTATTIAGASTESVEALQVGDGEEPLIDIVLGHAEISGTVCGPLTPPTLEPTGPGPVLPRTGGLGILPAVLGVGLLGGAVAAGRFALRSRGNGDSL